MPALLSIIAAPSAPSPPLAAGSNMPAALRRLLLPERGGAATAGELLRRIVTIAGYLHAAARRLALGEDVLRRKREAAGCFTSQLQNDHSTGQPAILPPHVLARLLHPYEIYFT